MAVIKCKMCGGDLVLTERVTVAECEYCGSKQTVPNVDNEKKLTLFGRANRLRLANDFDKAAGVYESIVAEFTEEAEAYWGLVLCRYGIEYVDDPATGKKIPTCHRSSFDSIFEDTDFEQACENADPIARRLYRDEAKVIEEIRKGILAVSNKEEPYDIFICYKETDENGERTIDSVIAQEVYSLLTEKGYRVFFSRISLESKLGTEYEPYIFAALNSAKVMLVFGTDFEYFNAVWVKNEWSRFLKLMIQDSDKYLIPCYKNIDAYDMPKEFARLQAQNMGKVGANQDLLRGIDKLFGRDEKKPAAPMVQQVVQSGGPNAVALLKRGNMALEDGNAYVAKRYFDDALNIDAELTDAYLGLTLVDFDIKAIEDLTNISFAQLTENKNFYRAMQFADPARKIELEQLIENARQVEIGHLLERGYRALEADNLEDSEKYKVQITCGNCGEEFYADEEMLIDEGLTCPDCGSKIKFDLEDYEKYDARFYFCAALRLDTQSVNAYLGLMLADLHVKSLENLVNMSPAKLTENRNFQRAMQFADSAQKAELEQLVEDARRLEIEQELKNGNKALRYSDEGAAICCFNKALNMEAESVDAYLGLTLVDFHVKALEDLANISSAQLAENRNFQLAMQFADPARKAELEQSIENARRAKQADQYLEPIRKKSEAALGYFSAGFSLTVGLQSDGTVIAVGDNGDNIYKITGISSDGTIVSEKDNSPGPIDVKDWRNIVAVFAVDSRTVGLRSDGTLIIAKKGKRNDEIYSWSNIVAISGGTVHLVGLKCDGTVVAAGENEDGQCDVENWHDITAVSGGDFHTVGLRADGTVVAAGKNEKGQCNVENWHNIVAISAGGSHTIGLKVGGTVVAVGENEDGQCDVENWHDIVAVSAGYSHTVGLRADGTVVAAGEGCWGQCNVQDWHDIVAISAGDSHTVGLKADGTVVAAGKKDADECNVQNWKLFDSIDTLIEAGSLKERLLKRQKEQKERLTPIRKKNEAVLGYIGAGSFFTIGLQSDGTVIAADCNKHHPGKVANWHDIVAVSARSSHTVGLKPDGPVVAAGKNEDGQCDVESWRDITAVSTGFNHTIGLKADGTVVAAGKNEKGQCNVENWHDIVAVSAGFNHTIGLQADGTVVAVGKNEFGQCDVESWHDIVAICAGNACTIGLRSDGTVMAAGYNEFGQCDVANWRDIVAVSGGVFHTVGLRADGTVVAVGKNEFGQCDVASWCDIVAVSAGYSHTIGLRADGTVVAAGKKDEHQCNVQSWKLFSNIDALIEVGSPKERLLKHQKEQKEQKERLAPIRKKNKAVSGCIGAGNCFTVGLQSDGTVVATDGNKYHPDKVANWRDIVAVSAGECHAVGLKADGTVVAVGWNEDRQCNVKSWHDITAVSAGEFHTIGLKADGTVVAAGKNEKDQCNVAYWHDIVAVSTGRYHTVGLKADGTVIATGGNGFGQCEVESWGDIVAISAHLCFTIGLRADGTVIAAGSNDFGQCDVANWRDNVAVSTSNSHTVGLKSDGTVVAVGENEFGQCDVESWRDIVAVAAGHNHTIGLRADGTVAVVGNNEFGQCDVQNWKLFSNIDALEQERIEGRQRRKEADERAVVNEPGILKKLFGIAHQK